MKIKICGVTTVSTAHYCADHEIDFVGFVFEPASPRYITLDQAQPLIEIVLRAEKIPVAVFMDQSPEQISAICTAASINFVQLHGESRQANLPKSLIKIIACRSIHESKQHALRDQDLILFDNKIPGSGEPLDYQKFSYTGKNLFGIAGGLNSLNVKHALCMNPFFVDVSSGVEISPGIKDHQKIRAFIDAVHQGAQ